MTSDPLRVTTPLTRDDSAHSLVGFFFFGSDILEKCLILKGQQNISRFDEQVWRFLKLEPPVPLPRVRTKLGQNCWAPDATFPRVLPHFQGCYRTSKGARRCDRSSSISRSSLIEPLLFFVRLCWRDGKGVLIVARALRAGHSCVPSGQHATLTLAL